MLRARTICETLSIGNHPFPLSKMKRRQRQRRRRRRRRTNAICKTTFNRRSSVRKRQIRARPRRGTDRYARTRPKKYHGTTLKVNKRTTGCEHEGNFFFLSFFYFFLFFFLNMIKKTRPYSRQTKQGRIHDNQKINAALRPRGLCRAWTTLRAAVRRGVSES